MTPNLFFAGFSSLTIIALMATSRFYRKAHFNSILGLFAFGMLISIPFILIEHLGRQLSLIHVIIAFIVIELGILFSEHHIKYFHDLIHHNVKELRIASFLLIGFGFTYAEIGFTILHSQDLNTLIHTIPFKATYALLMHTVFASAASLIQVGKMIANSLFETVFRFVTYYIRIAVISISHFVYVFSVEHNLMLLIGALLLISIPFFFHVKKKLDLNPETIE